MSGPAVGILSWRPAFWVAGFRGPHVRWVVSGRVAMALISRQEAPCASQARDASWRHPTAPFGTISDCSVGAPQKHSLSGFGVHGILLGELIGRLVREKGRQEREGALGRMRSPGEGPRLRAHIWHPGGIWFGDKGQGLVPHSPPTASRVSLVAQPLYHRVSREQQTQRLSQVKAESRALSSR